MKSMAIAASIAATVSISALSLSLIHPTSGHAEDAPVAPTVQTYTAPDTTSPTITHNAPTYTAAPLPVPTPPQYTGAPAPYTPPTMAPDPGSAASIPVPTTAGTVEPGGNRVIPPCAVEDATNCYWDAATMGNGQGRSFINWNGVYYYAG